MNTLLREFCRAADLLVLCLFLPVMMVHACWEWAVHRDEHIFRDAWSIWRQGWNEAWK